MTRPPLRVQMARIRADLADRSRQVVQGSARVLFNEMSSGGNYSPGTPIDTGFHRSHWNAAIGAIPDGGAATTPGEAAARVDGAISDFAPGDALFITNNGPAIRRLEFDGWSQQAPDGFIRPATEAIQQIVDEVVAAVVAR